MKIETRLKAMAARQLQSLKHFNTEKRNLVGHCIENVLQVYLLPDSPICFENINGVFKIDNLNVEQRQAAYTASRQLNR